jgi:Uma2 family endonuclease
MGVRDRLFTADEYYRLAEVGILHEDDRVELLDGVIVEMTPIGVPHAACVDRLNVLLQRGYGDRAIVRVQGPIRLNPYSEPQPDLSILKPRADFYGTAHPGPADVLVVIEIADTSLRYDRDVKMPLYARAGIAEYWLIDVVNDTVEVFGQPGPGGYLASELASRGDRLPTRALSGVDLMVTDILGEP